MRNEMSEPEILPVHPSDWIVTTDGRELFKVRTAYLMDGVIYMDLYQYGAHGERMPRQSPHMGGPRTFEPSITFEYDRFIRVKMPQFPLCDTPRRAEGPGFQPVTISFLPDLEQLPWRETAARVRNRKITPIGFTPEERAELRRSVRIRELNAAADTLEQVTEGAFVVMSTEDIRTQARNLRAEAASLEEAP